MRPVVVAVTLLLAAAPARAQEVEEEPPPAEELTEAELAALLEQAGETVVVEEKVRVTPGSAQTIDKETLERHERDDIHHVLLGVPGVYIREEDGFGLRPNIGMRGVSSERSAKIALMEDGVPIAPAPYSAPAAYYFPLVTRMESIDVTKGPAAILHGPNTVGGAVNLVARDIPYGATADVDAALGGDGYRKLHLAAGDRGVLGGLLVEGVTLGSDGFKRLDGGGDTGFRRHEVVTRGRLNTDPDRPRYHQLDLKLSWSDEGSNETYTGLTDADFLATPYRRYAGTRLDRVDATHLGLRADHMLQLGGDLTLTTTVYRNTFGRVWRKLNGFAQGRPLEDVLAAPDSGTNELLYQILSGQADSTSSAEALVIGTNDRSFVSQGVQTTARTGATLGGFDHQLTGGVRLHLDSALRDHTEESFLMMGGELERDDSPLRQTRDATGSATALALFAQDQARRGPLVLTAGLRTELIASREEDYLVPDMDQSERYAVFIPGGGAFLEITEWAGVLAGVHKGFVPVSPGQGDQASPEESVNYELGARVARPSVRGELTGFFTDYANLKGTCSFSSGCPDEQVEDEFDGGDVFVWGAEAAASGEVRLGGALWLPLAASYTYTRSSFQTSFVSDNPEWGNVQAGDELPYVPAHQLAAEVAVRMAHWETAFGVRHTSEMRDVAGSGALVPADSTDAITVFDIAAHAYLGRYGDAYVTIDNVADTADVVARRPFGARPGKPRTVILGYKNRF